MGWLNNRQRLHTYVDISDVEERAVPKEENQPYLSQLSETNNERLCGEVAATGVFTVLPLYSSLAWPVSQSIRWYRMMVVSTWCVEKFSNKSGTVAQQ